MQQRARTWFERHSSVWTDWPLARLLDAKLRLDRRVSLIIPARDEADTIGDIVAVLWRALVKDAPLLDQLIVIDSDSADRTATVAAGAGATVYRAAEIAPELGSHPGKGEAIWKSLFVTDGDLLVFVDGDLTDWGPHFVTGLLGPLLDDAGTLLGPGGVYAAAVAAGWRDVARRRAADRVRRPAGAQPVLARADRRPAATGRRMGGPARI